MNFELCFWHQRHRFVPLSFPLASISTVCTLNYENLAFGFYMILFVLIHPNFSKAFSISLIGKSTYLSKTVLKTESPLFCAFTVVL